MKKTILLLLIIIQYCNINCQSIDYLNWKKDYDYMNETIENAKLNEEDRTKIINAVYKNQNLLQYFKILIENEINNNNIKPLTVLNVLRFVLYRDSVFFNKYAKLILKNNYSNFLSKKINYNNYSEIERVIIELYKSNNIVDLDLIKYGLDRSIDLPSYSNQYIFFQYILQSGKGNKEISSSIKNYLKNNESNKDFLNNYSYIIRQIDYK